MWTSIYRQIGGTLQRCGRLHTTIVPLKEEDRVGPPTRAEMRRVEARQAAQQEQLDQLEAQQAAITGPKETVLLYIKQIGASDKAFAAALIALLPQIVQALQTMQILPIDANALDAMILRESIPAGSVILVVDTSPNMAQQLLDIARNAPGKLTGLRLQDGSRARDVSIGCVRVGDELVMVDGDLESTPEGRQAAEKVRGIDLLQYADAAKQAEAAAEAASREAVAMQDRLDDLTASAEALEAEAREAGARRKRKEAGRKREAAAAIREEPCAEGQSSD